MRALVEDLHVRLSAAGLHVLRPEQREEAIQGRRPGQPGGLGAYLAQHPGGYVQLEAPFPVRSDGLAGVLQVAVAAVAPTPEAAHALGLQVRRLLCGFPYAPGPYRESRPADPESIHPGVWLYRPTYERTTFDGLLAGG